MEKDSTLADLYHGYPQILHYRWGQKETITRLIRGVTAHIMKNKIPFSKLPGMYFGKVVHFEWKYFRTKPQATEFFITLLNEFEKIHPITVKKMRECISCSFENPFPQELHSFSIENDDKKIIMQTHHQSRNAGPTSNDYHHQYKSFHTKRESNNT